MENRNMRSGFTLVELLAVIMVLSLVVGLTIYIAISIIGSSKEKTYDVTVNMIENVSNEYLLENSNRLFFISGSNGIEYQCVTIQNLIDLGYLKDSIVNSKINKNTNVSKDDYVYLERNTFNKAITKKIYINNDDFYLDICAAAVTAIGSIDFSVFPDIDEWSKEKEIIITYRLRNLNDYNTLDEYTYNYNYSGINELIFDNDTVKKIKVSSNGKLDANIKNNDEKIVINDLDISKIDTNGPIISIINNTSVYKTKTAVISLKVVDNEVDVNYNSFTKDDLIVKVGDITINDYSFTYTSNGIYKLTVNDSNNSGNITITVKENTVYDMLSNGNNLTTLKSNIIMDNTKPTCSISKSNVGSESGVTLNISCNDNSGSCSTSKTSVTGVKNGNYKYTVTDGVGNTNTCSTSVSSYNCNAYQYKCGSYACGSYACGTYEDGQTCSAKCCYRYGSYICGEWECGTKCEPIIRTKYCTSYCPTYCTGYKTCYK